jgi:hypothetical protein
MRKLILIAASGLLLASCTPGTDLEKSCAQIADERAARQLHDDMGALERQETGPAEPSEVERKLIDIDAKAYRDRVYSECLQRRGDSADEAEEN